MKINKLKLKYGLDFIAKSLHELYTKNSAQPIILSGLRGIENAKYCRLHNDIVIYLKANKSSLLKRLIKDKNYTKKQAEEELKEEEKLYQTTKIEKVVDLVVDTTKLSINQAAIKIIKFVDEKTRMCKICVNSNRNPSIKIDKSGLCNICKNYFKNLT